MTMRNLFLVLGLMAALGGCFDDDTGPAKVRFDRDGCEMCRMLISDPRFATQVRGGPGHKAHKFDDIGDAIHWLSRQDWADDAKVEIWVGNFDTGKGWLDARRAAYVGGVVSPMDYGYGAIAEPRDGTVDFAALRTAVMARGLSSRCEDPELHAKGEAHDHKDENMTMPGMDGKTK